MLRRIGFRRVLPILATLVHLVAARPHVSLAARPEATYVPATYQESDAVDWQPEVPKPLSAAQRIAIVLNLPALVLGVPIALAFFRGNEIGSLYAAVPFVPLVWYGVGRWVDRLFGYIPELSNPRRRWRWLFATISTLFICLGGMAASPLNQHRTADTYWLASALMLWSGLFLFISASKLRRSNN